MSPRGRGRPPTFLQAERDTYLTAVAAGLPLPDAATLAGITPQWANRVAAADPAFRSARDLAKKRGKQARIDRLPHDEYRYNHHKCRCIICTTAATHARNQRRHPDQDDTTSPATPPPPRVINIREHGPHHTESSPPLLLARAS